MVIIKGRKTEDGEWKGNIYLTKTSQWNFRWQDLA